MSSNLIYALVDPRDGAWRYIGKSSHGLKRPRHHACASILRINTNPHKCNWIRRLLALGMMYRVEILEELRSAEQIDTAEVEWIAEARRQGARLLNVENGGNRGRLGLKSSPEHIEKISRSHKGLRHTAETRARMSAARKGRQGRRGPKHSLEVRAQMSVTRRGRIPWNKGMRTPPETRARQSAAALARRRKTTQ